MGLCAQTEWTYLEFQFTVTFYMSMATKSSDLNNWKTGASIQTEGHTLTLPNSQHDPEDTEAFGSAPSWSQSQCPVRKSTPDCPWNLVLFGNTSDFYWRWGNYTTTTTTTTTTTCLAGASCGRHGLRWQIHPNRSSTNGPRLSHPVLSVAVIRRTELGWGMRCHVYTVGSHWLGW